VLKWLTGEKVDHPLAEARRAREIMAELPAGDSAKALEEITYWLDSLNHTEGFKLERRFEIIDMLDAAAKSHQRKLSQDYLGMARQQKFREHKLWTGVFGYWKELANAYLLCVSHYESGTSSSTAVKKSLPVIVARSLRALTLQLKWVLMRYGPVESDLWTHIGRLYQVAEAGAFHSSVLAIYPGNHGGGSVRQEFLKAMMLSASSTDSLTPARQEIAERVVAHLSGQFVLESSPAADCHYCFDLAAARAPQRVLPGMKPQPTHRFFGAGKAYAQLQDLLVTVTETGALPQDFNLGGSYDVALTINVFKHLDMYWSDTPPARGSERRRTASRLTVVPGFGDIVQTLDPASGDALDFSEQTSAESWIVENVSDGGYGAIIPAAAGDWIRVGALIAVQAEGGKFWGVGLIRRVTRDEHQQRRVGIQLLTKAAIPIRIAHAAMGRGAETEPAILLSTAPDPNGEVGVLMRVSTFNPRDSLDMSVRDKGYLLMPSQMVEGGEDFDWAKFKVMRRAAAGEE